MVSLFQSCFVTAQEIRQTSGNSVMIGIDCECRTSQHGTMSGCMKSYQEKYSVRYLGFECNEEEKSSFYQGSCFASRSLFFVYRLLVSGYTVGMTIWFQVNLKQNEPEEYSKSYLYFTNWGDIMITTYFFLAALLSLIGGILEYKNEFVMVLRSTTWLFFTPASVAQLLITPLFWTFSQCTSHAECSNIYLNVHRHGITLMLICIDMFISAYPIRLLHVLYAILGGTAYVIVSVTGHLVGGVPAVYEYLNWHENTWLIPVLLILGWTFAILAQHVWFGLYLVRCEILPCTSRILPSPGSRRMDIEIDTIA